MKSPQQIKSGRFTYILLNYQTDSLYPMRKFVVQGDRGLGYTVSIQRYPRCDCPDCKFRYRRCKHMDFILKEVLKEDHPRLFYNNNVLEKMFENLGGKGEKKEKVRRNKCENSGKKEEKKKVKVGGKVGKRVRGRKHMGK